MQNLLIVLTGIFAFFAVYLILLEIFRVSDYSAERAVRMASRKKKKTKTDDLIYSLSIKLAKYIKLDVQKKKELIINLKSANMEMTPEVYVAMAIVKSGLILLFVYPVFKIIPLVSPMVVVLAISLYLKEMKRAGEVAKENKSKIEWELPRFVDIAGETFKSNRDVLTLLENYKKTAGEAFKNELSITIVDMQTGNYETALKRLESRVLSSQLSEVVRGLISVLRGDDGVVYFQMLSHDFKQLEVQRLKKIAMKRPQKIKKYSIAMVVCFVLTYIIVLGISTKTSMSMFM